MYPASLGGGETFRDASQRNVLLQSLERRVVSLRVGTDGIASLDIEGQYDKLTYGKGSIQHSSLRRQLVMGDGPFSQLALVNTAREPPA